MHGRMHGQSCWVTLLWQVLQQHGIHSGSAHLWNFLSEPENRRAVATAEPPPVRKKKKGDDEEDSEEEEQLIQWKLGLGPVDRNGKPLVREGTYTEDKFDHSKIISVTQLIIIVDHKCPALSSNLFLFIILRSAVPVLQAWYSVVQAVGSTRSKPNLPACLAALKSITRSLHVLNGMCFIIDLHNPFARACFCFKCRAVWCR